MTRHLIIPEWSGRQVTRPRQSVVARPDGTVWRRFVPVWGRRASTIAFQRGACERGATYSCVETLRDFDLQNCYGNVLARSPLQVDDVAIFLSKPQGYRPIRLPDFRCRNRKGIDLQNVSKLYEISTCKIFFHIRQTAPFKKALEIRGFSL